jgi:hypothetical protein
MTTTYTFDQLKEDVRKEAEALRVHATKEEREKLDISKLQPEHRDRCIYGQMTGNCDSDRSIALIRSCAHRLIQDYGLTEIKEQGFERIERKASIEPIEYDLEYIEEARMVGSHYSAIEAYILLPEAKNANLIAFLKGETDNLEL